MRGAVFDLERAGDWDTLRGVISTVAVVGENLRYGVTGGCGVVEERGRVGGGEA